MRLIFQHFFRCSRVFLKASYYRLHFREDVKSLSASQPGAKMLLIATMLQLSKSSLQNRGSTWAACPYRLLPDNVFITGYARSKLSDEDLKEKVRPNLKGDDKTVEKFLKLLSYTPGAYDEAEGFQKLQKALQEREQKHKEDPVGRLYYLALPPSVYPEVLFLAPSYPDTYVTILPMVLAYYHFGASISKPQVLVTCSLAKLQQWTEHGIFLMMLDQGYKPRQSRKTWE